MIAVQHWASLLLLCKAWDRLAELGAQLSKRASLLIGSGTTNMEGVAGHVRKTSGNPDLVAALKKPSTGHGRPTA